MRVLVTGATGFLGSHLAETLLEGGHSVRALVRRTSKTDHLERVGAELHAASLETGEGLPDAVRDVDVVVHGAAVVKARSAEEFHEVNAGGTKRLLDAVKTHRPGLRRFVLVSSLAAHGFPSRPEPKRLEDAPTPVTHYGRSKLAAERFVLAEQGSLPVTVIRPPAIYGPRDTEMFAFFQMIQRRVVPFLGSSENLLSLVYAPDCARAIALTVTKDHPSGRIYFVDDGRHYTQREFAEEVARALGVRIMSFPVPIAVVSAAAVGSELYGRLRGRAVMLTRDKVNELKQPYLICRGEEIRAELGFAPEVQLPDGARRTAEWYRSQGWL